MSTQKTVRIVHQGGVNLKNVISDSVSLISIGRGALGVQGLDEFFAEVERVCGERSAVVISDIAPNSEMIAVAYARFGFPRRVLFANTGFTVLVFFPFGDCVKTKFPVFGADWLEEQENKFNSKKARSKDLERVADEAKLFGLSEGKWSMSYKLGTRRTTTVFPYLVQSSPRDLNKELRTLQLMTMSTRYPKRAGDTYPLRLARFLLGALLGNNRSGELVLDLSGEGVFAHALTNSYSTGHHRMVSCLVDGSDEVTMDRLESLSLGSWKNWTYHEPAIFPLDFVE